MTSVINNTDNDLDLIQAIIERDMRIAALENQIEQLKVCPTFDVFTRQALSTIDTSKATHVVFLDFDNMKAANAEFGYTEVDRKIKNIFSHTREGDVIPVRWYSGDEFILLGDYHKLRKVVERLENIAKYVEHMSFTYAYATLKGRDLTEAVSEASTKVMTLKNF